jgi:hypothetical protein
VERRVTEEDCLAFYRALPNRDRAQFWHVLHAFLGTPQREDHAG